MARPVRMHKPSSPDGETSVVVEAELVDVGVEAVAEEAGQAIKLERIFHRLMVLHLNLSLQHQLLRRLLRHQPLLPQLPPRRKPQSQVPILSAAMSVTVPIT